jgi:hypothetical protein
MRFLLSFLLLTLTACSDDDSAADSGTAIDAPTPLIDASTIDHHAIDGSGIDAPPPADASPGPDAACVAPVFPQDCAGVSTFECGFGASCVGGTTIHAEWHVHFFCGGVEDIIPYSCDHACACATGTIEDWPASGAALVEGYCL